MKDINKEEFSDFEKAWQQAFEQAEMPVGPDVWNNIDGHLANNEADKYKRKIIFYKWVAAASVVFAISLSVFNYHYNASKVNLADAENPLLQNNRTSTTEPSPKEVYANRNNDAEGDKINSADIKANGLAIQRDMSVRDERTESDIESNTGTKPSNASSNNLALAQAKVSVEESAESQAGLHKGRSSQVTAESNNVGEELSTVMSSSDTERNTIALAIIQQRNAERIALPQEGQPYYMEHYAQLLEPPYIYAIPGVKMLTKEDKPASKIMWAGLNVGSGIFDPHFENGSNYQPPTSPALSKTYAAARESPQAATYTENTSAGVSYSLGLNFGMRLNKKWVLQSGVQYAYKSASTNSTTYLRNNYDERIKPALTNATNTEALNFSNASFTQEYDLLNSFEFATIPVKAGYLLVDRKVGLMLTAGVGADIFLSNTLSENNDRLDDVRMTSGSESPFRDVNFNGLVGAELFYKISRQYHLTLEPNYSIALSPITKSQSDFRSHPQTFGITAGLKYYWK